MQLLSRVRMGVLLGLVDDLHVSDVNKLLVRTQPAHLQKMRGVDLDTKDPEISSVHDSFVRILNRVHQTIIRYCQKNGC